ncbi:hypothetical protein COO60DRAFT_1645765 [Scenedesmus sp. NREL 46B-D3]|nr:hypothetical protein COO60DRAFT_1645765 [Scenedesmus sp. NREL 46B-D3]
MPAAPAKKRGRPPGSGKNQIAAAAAAAAEGAAPLQEQEQQQQAATAAGSSSPAASGRYYFTCSYSPSGSSSRRAEVVPASVQPQQVDPSAALVLALQLLLLSAGWGRWGRMWEQRAVREALTLVTQLERQGSKL